MTTEELRKIANSFTKYPGTKLIVPSNVVNDGFPSSFNLSFGEGPMHKAFGQYLNYDKDLVFSTIQPCIRHEDWQKIINNESVAFRYLGLFDMAGVGGLTVLQDSGKIEEVAKFHMKAILDFLKTVGLNLEKLKVLYFTETSIEVATKGKYAINKNFPTDLFYKYWIDLGLKEKQLIKNKDRNTLLSLNVFGLPTPWGYRYELLYDYNGSLWDIATVEYMTQRPIYEAKDIIDIMPFNHCIGVSVVGLERINVILNDRKAVWNIDTIKPLIEFVSKVINSKNENDVIVVTQAFRVIHKIIADGNIYASLNKKRKQHIRSFYREFLNKTKKLEIEFSNFIEQLCDINAKANPWYPELLNSKSIVINEFKQRKEAFENDKSVKHRDVAQQ